MDILLNKAEEFIRTNGTNHKMTANEEEVKDDDTVEDGDDSQILSYHY
jgi:hypothetical protein